MCVVVVSRFEETSGAARVQLLVSPLPTVASQTTRSSKQRPLRGHLSYPLQLHVLSLSVMFSFVSSSFAFCACIVCLFLLVQL